ncbi:unnamed protein product [Symbiodinium sp. CCMP2592]|nr:unnamed protein product [Symbiodinium sp. CCMP2592]
MQDIIVFENTPQYQLAILQEKFGREYEIRSASKARWTTHEPLENLVKVFFAAPKMEAVDYFYLDKPATVLNPAQTRTKRTYMEAFGDSKKVFDLAQQSSKFLRTELHDNTLMTLKRNCGNLFSTRHNRTIDKEELFTAETAGSSSVDLSPLPTASLASCLAGNGMHVAQAGAIILICALFIEAVPEHA